MTRLLPLLFAFTVVASVPAQTPAPPAETPPPVDDPASPPPPTPPTDYVYMVDGRRDPFVPLVGRPDQRAGGAVTPIRGEGVAGLLTDEIVVRGILLSQGRWVAMIGGPSGRVFTVRPGDRVADGTIRDITQQYIVIQQEVDDPLAPQKQRDVRKFLRGGENK